MKFSTKPSRRETIGGSIYLFLYIFVLTWLVPVAVHFLKPDFNAAQMNFVYFGVNFAATTVIFRKYLLRSLDDALFIGFPTLWYALLGYLGNLMLSGMVASAILDFYPEFANVNDATVMGLADQNMALMFIGAVVLAPVTEELLFRGLIFRGLYDRSPLAAHLVTMVLFSLIHVTGYIGVYDWKLLFCCFLQYLAPAYCLNFAYQQSGTIFSSIAMHMITNLMAFAVMR